MERLNGEGIPRSQLAWALTQAHLVRSAIKIDSCLLCRAERVNEAGLCNLCYTLLQPNEQVLAERWFIGMAP